MDIQDKCYSDENLPEIQRPEFPVSLWNEIISPICNSPWQWLCELYPDLDLCKVSTPTIQPPLPWNPSGPWVGLGNTIDCNNQSQTDCERVMVGIVDNSVRRHLSKRNVYVVIKTGEELVCNLEQIHEPNKEFINCVEKTLSCIFEPYKINVWKAPSYNCDSFYFRGQNSKSNKICISNCSTQRLPIYQYEKDSSSFLYGTNEEPPTTYTLTSDIPVFWILKDEVLGSIPFESLGYVFPSASSMVPYLEDNEKSFPVYSYQNGDNTYLSHLNIGKELDLINDSEYYIYPNSISWNIKYIVQKSDGESTFGVYIRNDDTIVWNYVIIGDVDDNDEISNYEIDSSIIDLYYGHYLGFFIINDDSTTGSTLTFNFSNGVYKRSNDVVIFSNSNLNDSKRKKCQFNGVNVQVWGSDYSDDYIDDIKIYYELITSSNESIKTLGIEFFTFQNDKQQIIQDLSINEQRCEVDNYFESSFENVYVTRNGCGTQDAPVVGLESGSPCGECNGNYIIEQNREQSIKAIESSKYQIRSFGFIGIGSDVDCFRFELELLKNDETLFTYTTAFHAFPSIGGVIGSDFYLDVDDVLTLNVKEIIAAPQDSQIEFQIILFDLYNQNFERPITITLGSVSIDDYISPQTEVQTSLPSVCDEAGNIGKIKKLSLALYDGKNRGWTRSIDVWDGSQLDTNKSNGQLASWQDVYFSNSYYEGSETRQGLILSSHIDSNSEYSDQDDPINTGIFYNDLFQFGKGLITKPSNNIDNLLTDYAHWSNLQRGFGSWFLQKLITSEQQQSIDNYYGKLEIVESNGQYSKMSFIRDYSLPGSASVRMIFFPYTINTVYWGCSVELLDLLETGEAYAVGDTFEFEYPSRENLHTISSPSNIIIKNVRYTPKQAFYQESYNLDSNIWYLCQNREVERVRFRLTIEEVECDES